MAKSLRYKAERAKRLSRLVRIRASGAPAWIVKSDQVGLVAVRRGLRAPTLGQTPSVLIGELVERHVTPLMEG